MPITFYPQEDDMQASVEDRLEVLKEAAERYKALVLDAGTPIIMSADSDSDAEKKILSPRNLRVSFNWQEMAKILREIRELTESNQTSKLTKAGYLKKLAEVYEILRGAKMPKLEAVRLALMNESEQLSK